MPLLEMFMDSLTKKDKISLKQKDLALAMSLKLLEKAVNVKKQNALKNTVNAIKVVSNAQSFVVVKVVLIIKIP